MARSIKKMMRHGLPSRLWNNIKLVLDQPFGPGAW